MKPANVIVCLCDMLRPFELGCYGHPAVRTPHIDRLAAEGVRFELAVTSNPLCTPARSSLIFSGNAGDPYQFRNLAATAEQAELGRALRERVVGWHASTPWLAVK